MRKLNDDLEKFMEEFDKLRMNGAVITGYSYFDIKAKKPDGEIVDMYNIPLQVHVDVLEDSEAEEFTGVENYFDVTDLTNYDPYVEDVESELLPEDWELVEVIGFSEGHSFEDLEIE